MMACALRHRIPTVALLLAVVSTASQLVRPSWGQTRDPASSGLTEIFIGRSGCFGTCPVYDLTLHADGSVEYYGGRHVLRLGRHVGRLPDDTFGDLAELATTLGIFELETSYHGGPTCQETIRISLVRRGFRKTIRHYAPRFTGPAELRRFEQELDATLVSIEWDQVPNSDPR